MKYIEIVRENKRLGGELKEVKPYEVTILSNVMMNQMHQVLEYQLRTEGINAIVGFGDYDNIVQDSLKFQNQDLVTIFWEAANLVDGFQYKAALMSDGEIEAIIEKTKGEIDFVLNNLNNTSLVIINQFSSLIFNSDNLHPTKFEYVCKVLNDYLETKKQKNTFIINIDKVIAKVSIENSFTPRNFYSSKMLYSIAFLNAYARQIKPIVRAANGKAKKALIFDCDNTLWKGVVGEDGMEGIKMSAKSPKGVVFEEVQSLGLMVNKKGILLGLCSKNNAADVDEVLEHHKDMLIQEENLTIKKVNWEDKASNIQNIAKTLNIGLDSLVFVDDSDFEVNLVRERLPQVTVLQVPKKAYNYPKLLRENLELFFNLSQTKEDLKKVEMYKSQVLRKEAESGFQNIEAYLESLELKLTLYVDKASIVPRMAQMTQKTNQFNLTTKRYTEADITNFVADPQTTVFAFGVSDKYGDSGVTGLLIAQETENQSAIVDLFLMSCRVIGRNIEIAFFDYVIQYLKGKGIQKLEGQYLKTIKNHQVKEFYDKLGMTVLAQTEKQRDYRLDLAAYNFKNLAYIKVENGA